MPRHIMYAHIVLKTRNGTPWLAGGAERDAHTAIRAWCSRKGLALIAIDGVEDHVHVLVRLEPNMTHQSVIDGMKWAARRAARHHHPSFRWARGYSMSSVSPRGVDRVARYVAGQKSHHARH